MSQRSRAIKIIGVVATMAVLALAGCREDTASSRAGGPPTQMETATAAASANPTESLPSQTPGDVRTTSFTTTESSKIAVPNGVGMNYQQAQDLWRGVGLHVAPATDATGAHRLPVIDSNWVVLSQDPPAGAMVDSGSFITATVKKYTDN